jgi:broad specificity phosphatase PhoE
MHVSRRFRYIAVGLLSVIPLFFASAIGWADDSIIIDFVRHGQSVGDAQGILETTPPGTDLTPEGVVQATSVGGTLAQPGPYAGLYASELARTEETAGYISDALNHMPVQTLPGLDEISAGIFDGQPVYSPEGILYLLAPVAWTLGAEFVPIPGSTTPNGIAFDESFSGAVEQIYDKTASATGSPPTDVAVSSEGAITTWELMNVKNPDFSLIFQELLKTGQLLPNGGQAVVQGDPQDGWTLVSFDGQPVPQDPGLPTELFVDARNVVEAPQFAAYNIYEALVSGDSPAAITSAIDGGLSQVLAATEQFPAAVLGDLTSALTADLSGAAANMALAAF